MVLAVVVKEAVEGDVPKVYSRQSIGRRHFDHSNPPLSNVAKPVAVLAVAIAFVVELKGYSYFYRQNSAVVDSILPEQHFSVECTHQHYCCRPANYWTTRLPD